MRIESVDLYYLSMPEVLDIGDGSQDLLLVRVQAGPYVGWGECEASPLASIASLVAPMSHSACKPVRDSVLGPDAGRRRRRRPHRRLVRANSLDLLQANHTLSGIDIAMWDLLGRRLESRSTSSSATRAPSPAALRLRPLRRHAAGDVRQGAWHRGAGYRAAKFGWGPYGLGSVAEDADQVAAAREGLGEDGILLVDAGTVWGDDVERARRAPAGACRRTARPGWRSRSSPARSMPIATLARAERACAARRRRGLRTTRTWPAT